MIIINYPRPHDNNVSMHIDELRYMSYIINDVILVDKADNYIKCNQCSEQYIKLSEYIKQDSENSKVLFTINI